jgi:broad specificity phosphatase PhoE
MTRRTFQADTPLQALVIEQALLLAKQLERTADEAPDGQVLSRLEALAVPAARDLARRAVEAALQAQAEAAEKKGGRAGPVRADGSCGTRGGPAATS